MRMARFFVVFLAIMTSLLAAQHVVAAPKRSADPPKGAPAYEAPPRPDDGANMALTVEKLNLQKGFDPDRPLLIWAIGSSVTNAQGNGSELIGMIRQRFPNAPKIVYKKMAGCSTSYHFLRGWARHLVIPDQPDVVLMYNYGNTDELEKVIIDLRKHTTADIIVPTLHWCIPHKKVWPDPELKNSHQDPPGLRAMCKKHGVEFVESRRELTEYMLANKLVMEDMLGDSVHQNRFASKSINANIARHFHAAKKPAYDPRSRERRLEMGDSSAVEFDRKDWKPGQDGKALTAERKGASVSVRFTGNRIDLIGWSTPKGGSVDVWLDGKPIGQTKAFYAGYVQPDRRNAVKPPMPPRDRCPHGVTLGTNIVPQNWTITMTGDRGDFQLTGSLTGPDGRGNSSKPFQSNSGQIVIDPQLWRAANTNRTGDLFTFDVTRCVTETVSFKAPEPTKFRLRLAGNLSNKQHTLKLVANGDGPVTIDGFDVFEPPMK